MKIEFAPGAAGFHEARELGAMVRYVVHNTVSGSHDVQLLDTIEKTAASYMQRPEFADLVSREGLDAEDRPLLTRFVEFWCGIWGPSRREIELSRQRIVALERAERAERSSFEALAEMARVARERDEARQELQELAMRVARLETELRHARPS